MVISNDHHQPLVSARVELAAGQHSRNQKQRPRTPVRWHRQICAILVGGESCSLFAIRHFSLLQAAASNRPGNHNRLPLPSLPPLLHVCCSVCFAPCCSACVPPAALCCRSEGVSWLAHVTLACEGSARPQALQQHMLQGTAGLDVQGSADRLR